jgi:hypothetical protein
LLPAFLLQKASLNFMGALLERCRPEAPMMTHLGPEPLAFCELPGVGSFLHTGFAVVNNTAFIQTSPPLIRILDLSNHVFNESDRTAVFSRPAHWIVGTSQFLLTGRDLSMRCFKGGSGREIQLMGDTNLRQIVAPVCSDGHFIYSISECQVGVYSIEKVSGGCRLVYHPNRYLTLSEPLSDRCVRSFVVTNGLVLHFFQQMNRTAPFEYAQPVYSLLDGRRFHVSTQSYPHRLLSACYDAVSNSIFALCALPNGLGVAKLPQQGPRPPWTLGLSLKEPPRQGFSKLALDLAALLRFLATPIPDAVCQFVALGTLEIIAAIARTLGDWRKPPPVNAGQLLCQMGQRLFNLLRINIMRCDQRFPPDLTRDLIAILTAFSQKPEYRQSVFMLCLDCWRHFPLEPIRELFVKLLVGGDHYCFALFVWHLEYSHCIPIAITQSILPLYAKKLEQSLRSRTSLAFLVLFHARLFAYLETGVDDSVWSFAMSISDSLLAKTEEFLRQCQPPYKEEVFRRRAFLWVFRPFLIAMQRVIPVHGFGAHVGLFRRGNVAIGPDR